MSKPIHFPRVMSNWDAAMWRMEENPLLRSTTAAVTLLEKPPRRDVLAARMRRAVRDIPRLRQRVVKLPRVLSNPVWSDHADFDLDYHLRWIRAPLDGGLRALLDHAASLAMQSFDRDRPLWEFVVVEDLADGRAALIQKLHHAVTDGVGGVLLMQRVYDATPDTSLPAEGPASRDAGRGESALDLALEAARAELARRPQLARQGLGALLRFAREPLGSAREAVSTVVDLAPLLNPPTRPLSPILRARSARYRFEVLEFPLAQLKHAGRAAGCTLNDAYLTAICGGWRRYHELHGASTRKLRVDVPISLRDAATQGVAGNRITFATLEVPLAQPDPRRRMRAIHRLMAAQRARPGLQYAEALAGFTNLLPSLLFREITERNARGVDFIASSVPGPRRPLYVAGARVRSIFPFGPTLATAANLTLFSQADLAEVTLNVDPAAIPDHGELVECMRQGFDEVLHPG